MYLFIFFLLLVFINSTEHCIFFIFVVRFCPYFSLPPPPSVLHLYETLGWWRKANYLKIHFAESWNEMHHLLIMEELGGSKLWKDRFVAQHTAFFYYWIVVALYMLNPTMAYNINQYVEEHAYATYDNFLREHEAELKQYPAPKIATQYYRDGDLYMFYESQTNTDCAPRRPVINNLYDVFVAIRDDELDHVKTMVAMQQDIELTSANGEICMLEKEEACTAAGY
jgi:ubiquinol oxidase